VAQQYNMFRLIDCIHLFDRRINVNWQIILLSGKLHQA